MKSKCVFLMIVLVLVASVGMAQADRKYNREAMRAMEDGKYNEAIINFQKAMKENQDEPAYINNLGHAHFRNENYENAAEDYTLYADKSGLTKSEQFYNMGNAYLQAGEYDKGIKSYIESLKIDPDDQETKYNLSMAHAMKRQQQQRQQQQQDQQQKQDQNQNKDKQQQQQNKDNKEDNKDKEQQQQQQQPQQQEMSREDAERMLQALQKKEEDLQDKQKKKAKARVRQPEKDW